MTNKYYVIVDLDTLNYMLNGTFVSFNNADKFKDIEDAREELKTYDDDFNGAIYEVTEVITRGFEKVEGKK